MKLRLLLFSQLATAFLNDLLAVLSACITLPDGVILFTHPLLTGSPYAAKPLPGQLLPDRNGRYI
ncbi:hypothetical protein L3C95_30490 [Chitinophaga filiformis]|uniref:hypothetical protein n=1 Tax=Chitinophaga filiformis TaxID=104663 RepID=UPI001F45BB83|nr:hypothetical protein [Chitinophaga filiformis]MCF6407262.1 hypothetical protein [Chitinophaga filiformis]